MKIVHNMGLAIWRGDECILGSLFAIQHIVPIRTTQPDSNNYDVVEEIGKFPTTTGRGAKLHPAYKWITGLILSTIL